MPEFAENYLGYLLARCSYEVSAPFHNRLKEQGISVLTWRVLSSIRYQADTVNNLANKVLVNQSTLSKALDRMEKEQLVQREQLPEFRSKTNVIITAKGIAQIDGLIDEANEYEEHSLNHLNNEELQQLRQLLRKLIEPT